MSRVAQSDEMRRKNRRLALMLAGFALFIFATSFPFWQNVFQIFANQAGR